jgi:3-oxoacyl-[acyl-carrier protein] reductase
MSKKLFEKVAIVTGASKGLGASIAQHLAEEGAFVVVNYNTDKEAAERVVQSIGKNAVAIQGNMTHPSDIDHLFAETKRIFGKVDILVNNAGVYEFAPIEKITEDHFYKHFDLNVLGLLLTCQCAVKYLPAGGSIINISSLASKSWAPYATVYSATKAAVDSITKSLAYELGARQIRVNAINPGMIPTEGATTAGIIESELRKKVEARTPLGRLGKPQDIGAAAVFLASNDSDWITGETLLISGGFR